MRQDDAEMRNVQPIYFTQMQFKILKRLSSESSSQITLSWTFIDHVVQGAALDGKIGRNLGFESLSRQTSSCFPSC